MMQTAPTVAQDAPAPMLSGPLNTGVRVNMRSADVGFRRSAKNIAVWASYLPSACVEAMIKMGWDITT